MPAEQERASGASLTRLATAQFGTRRAPAGDHRRQTCSPALCSSGGQFELRSDVRRRAAPLGVICVVRLSASPAGARPDSAAHFALVELRRPDARAPRTAIKSQR